MSDSNDTELDSRRKKLEKSLSKGDKKNNPESKPPCSRAFALSSEFICPIVAGAGLGWVIDSWTGMKPFCLVFFLFIGFMAGVLNVLRWVK